MPPEHSTTAGVVPRERSEAQGILLKHMSQLNQRLLGPWEDAAGQRQPRLTLAEAVAHKPCHHFLYSGGAFARLYPVNPSPARNHAAKPKRRPLGRGRFALDMWGLVSVPYSRLKAPRM